MQIDSWMDDGTKAAICVEGQWFNAVCGSIYEGDTLFMARLPMENKCQLLLWVMQLGATVALDKGDIEGGAIHRSGTTWMDRVKCASDLRSLLKQIGRMEVRP